MSCYVKRRISAFVEISRIATGGEMLTGAADCARHRNQSRFGWREMSTTVADFILWRTNRNSMSGWKLPTRTTDIGIRRQTRYDAR